MLSSKGTLQSRCGTEPPRKGRMAQTGDQMSGVTIEIEEALAAILRKTNPSVQEAAREMIVLELYRRGTISSGKAGEILGVPRIDFIEHASRLGIPYFNMSEAEWAAEVKAAESL